MGKVNEREIILGTITAVFEEGEYSHLVMQDVLAKYDYLDKRQRAFITKVCEGCVERRITLDHVINQYAKTPVKKQKPMIRNVLRMSTYQILYLDHVPASAVVNEAVKLIQKRYAPLKGFVNGVLRSIARDKEDILANLGKAGWSVEYSVPQWIIDLWVTSYGKEKTLKSLQAFQKPSVTCIRTNRAAVTPEELKASLEKEGVKAAPVEGIDYGFYISGYDRLTELESFENGWFYIQDASSMEVAEAAGIKAHDAILDVCAAPGGKSLHMAEILKFKEAAEAAGNDHSGDSTAVPAAGADRISDLPAGSVEARDISEAKVDLIWENIERSGLSNITAGVYDAAEDDPSSHEAYDVVLADLPCSGLGIMGRKADIRYRITKEDLSSLAKLQQEMLSVVHRYVKPKGTLVYSTCTMNPAENEENVAAFLEAHPEFALEKQKQIFPEEGKHDGFFYAVLKKK